MQKIALYRFIRPDGGVTVSPVKPDTEYIERCRLVADENMAITNGVTVTTIVDVQLEDIENWTDCEIPEPEEIIDE